MFALSRVNSHFLPHPPQSIAGVYCSGPDPALARECRKRNSVTCDQRPCDLRVTCTDLPSDNTAFISSSICGHCPGGYIGDGTKCSGQHEWRFLREFTWIDTDATFACRSSTLHLLIVYRKREVPSRRLKFSSGQKHLFLAETLQDLFLIFALPPWQQSASLFATK